MPIEFACTGCNTRIEVPDSAAGKTGKCRTCGALVKVPGEKPKVCTGCGIDVTNAKRTKDAAGNYLCENCAADQIISEAEPDLSATQVKVELASAICSVCGKKFPYSDVVELGGVIKCRPCFTGKMAHSAAVDTSSFPPAGVTAADDLLLCPNCGGMFRISGMDESGVCKRCASANSNKTGPKSQNAKSIVWACVTVGIAAVCAIAFTMWRNAHRQALATQSVQLPASTVPIEPAKPAIAKAPAPSSEAELLLLQYAQACNEADAAKRLANSAQDDVDAIREQIGALGSSTDHPELVQKMDEATATAEKAMEAQSTAASRAEAVLDRLSSFPRETVKRAMEKIDNDPTVSIKAKVCLNRLKG